ncbi:leucyl aminopeptidase family protein [Nocardioides sp. SYSU D00038]|uniref:leucyl aminopeptidase family protein n=1 Tax=Nocardioides sp. SYSU D00038 TaxID=2812554 RepID=UPI0027DE69E2|nr:leucyl aminopeptidase family protein [Nocardioides sp. SYSU D00038]
MARQAALPSRVTPPQLALSPLLPHAVPGVDVVALPVLPADPADGDEARVLLGPGAEEVGDRLGLDLLSVLELDAATGRTGQVTAVPVPLGGPDNADLRWVLLVGVGAQTATDFRRAGAALARAARDRRAVATAIPSLDPATALRPFVAGAMLGAFSFQWRSGPPEGCPPASLVLTGLDPDADRDVLDSAVAIGGAAWLSRTLATVPSNLKDPPWLAGQARLVAEQAGLDFREWDQAALEKGGFGGLLAVGRASASEPRLVRLDYTPEKATRRTPTVVLVGKGITFDSGGLSIKPGEAMATMKRDMTGGAVVIATLGALRRVGCPVRVVGLVAAAENAVDGDALRPGDVIRHYGGRTSEVTNTDAEGRLVLADALAYAVDRLKPAAIVDVATLTGAIKVALGQQVGGLFATDDVLAAALDGAGHASGEALWRFPLSDSYADKLSSKVADADNAAGGPGAITSALFLRAFVGDVPWAHLDVASVGDAPADSHEWTTGPTGFGARLLLEWLGGPEPLAGVGG